MAPATTMRLALPVPRTAVDAAAMENATLMPARLTGTVLTAVTAATETARLALSRACIAPGTALIFERCQTCATTTAFVRPESRPRTTAPATACTATSLENTAITAVTWFARRGTVKPLKTAPWTALLATSARAATAPASTALKIRGIARRTAARGSRTKTGNGLVRSAATCTATLRTGKTWRSAPLTLAPPRQFALAATQLRAVRIALTALTPTGLALYAMGERVRVRPRLLTALTSLERSEERRVG